MILKKIISLAFLSGILFAANNNFICNNQVINNIYTSFNILSQNIRKTPLKEGNVEIIKIKIDKNKKQIVKYIKILDEELTNKIENNNLYKKIAFTLQQQKLCSKFNTKIGHCFLNSNKIIIDYLDSEDKNLGKIVLNKKNCKF